MEQSATPGLRYGLELKVLRRGNWSGTGRQANGRADIIRAGLAGDATPAFVYDEAAITRRLDHVDRLRAGVGCRVLFALKPFSFIDALSLMASRLDGFAVSSLFEARLARQALGHRGSLHVTTPGLRPDEVEALGRLCDNVSFNSLSQWDTYRDRMQTDVSLGLRVNPQMSFLEDDRYDPCRPYSKLGVPLEDLVAVLAREPDRLSGLEGVHVHTNCESQDFGELLATVEHLGARIGDLLGEIEWINLGGGYLIDESSDLEVLSETVALLRSNYGLEVFIEPGTAFVRAAGYLVSTVLDTFESGAKRIAVLDTSVNHMPEVFEYGFEPDVLGHDDDASCEVLLAGCTCLAGDLFGEYRFGEPLEVGARVVFHNAGAYTLSKAHMFNGVNLPAIYALTDAGELVLKRRFTYGDFVGRWTADVSVPV